jgi:hypothetical protein
MKRLLLLVVVGAVLFSAAPVLADDGFYVVGVRLTPGTKITSLPYTINPNAPGYYYLTGNLTSTGSNGITVNADNVTIDLMGFALSGPPNGLAEGITINANNVEIRNGTITGWYNGIYYGSGGSRCRAIGVRAVGNRCGISLGYDSLIKGCSASPGSNTTGTGLRVASGAISGCIVMNFSPNDSSEGQIHVLFGGRASDNLVLNCGSTGIRGQNSTTVTGNSVTNCKNGIDMSGGGSLIGNAVVAYSTQTALLFDSNGVNPVVADQNSFYASGGTFSSGTFVGTWGLNGGGPPPP